MADTPKPDAPAPDAAAPAADQQVTPEQIRSTLGLDPAAPDADVISALVAVVANLQARYEANLDESVKSETAVANREFARFASTIPEADHAFWINNLIVNREACLLVLEKISTASPSPVTPPQRVPALPAEGAALPLVNRAVRVPAPVAAPVSTDAGIAIKIRNRASELLKSGLGYRDAFDAAAREIS
jgi:hypothetical protein